MQKAEEEGHLKSLLHLEATQRVHVTSNLFSSRRKKIGWWDRLQAGEQSITTSKRAVHMHLVYLRATEDLHTNLLLYKLQVPSLEHVSRGT